MAEMKNKNIDFARLTGRKDDLVAHPREQKSSGSIKRNAPPDLPGRDRVDQMEARKRQRRASPTIPVNSNKDSMEAQSSFMSRKGSEFQYTKASVSSQLPSPCGLSPSFEPGQVRSNTSILIQSDESDAGEEQANKYGKPVKNKARGFEDVKTEPLTDDMIKKTMFLVTMYDSPIGPVPVPFTECGSFSDLFPVLIEERGVADEDASKIDNITTIFNWTGGDFGGRVGGIRRNRSGDWDYFCDSLRRAHEKDADRFQGKCEVAIKLHINSRHKENC